MAEYKIKDVFNGRFFEVPKYQRGYAWEIDNVRDLYDDIVESVETGSHHFLGTLVLSKNAKHDDHFYIVDGQQRIATITLFINELTKYLPSKDKSYFHRFYIKEDEDSFRLAMLGKDNRYLQDLINGKTKDPHNKSQKLLSEACEEIKTSVQKLPDKKKFLNCIEKLEVMEFIEQCEGDAIRIFQTVNDRGKPLSNMEKAKSLLIYFSNRYLNKKFDDRINSIFGEIFEKYDEIKTIGESEGIRVINDRLFDEDSIMRYHFLTFSDANYDATAPYVLTFLKRQLIEYRKQGKPGLALMGPFINKYSESSLEFFSSLRNILLKVQEDAKYYKLFVNLGLSTYLYPLVTKLANLGRLDHSLPDKKLSKYSFLDLIELIDVRIYKTKETDPRRDISIVAHEINSGWTDERLMNWLLEYNRKWLSKSAFETYLNDYIYGNVALPHIFIDYSEHLRTVPYTLDQLRGFHQTSPTVEHILSKTPKFTYKSVGFKSPEDFEKYENQLGNLTVVEKSINSAAQNKMPIEKVPQYDKSKYDMTKALSSHIHSKKKFTKIDVSERTHELSEYILNRWWC
jgi:hypothetical protein